MNDYEIYRQETIRQKARIDETVRTAENVVLAAGIMGLVHWGAQKLLNSVINSIYDHKANKEVEQQKKYYLKNEDTILENTAMLSVIAAKRNLSFKNTGDSPNEIRDGKVVEKIPQKFSILCSSALNNVNAMFGLPDYYIQSGEKSPKQIYSILNQNIQDLSTQQHLCLDLVFSQH